MNRDKVAATLGVSSNTVKNWSDRMHCKLPSSFTQADISLLKSYQTLAAQEPPLEQDTLILMLLPLINKSTVTKLDSFPYIDVNESVDSSGSPVAAALPYGDTEGRGEQQQGGIDAAVKQGLRDFVEESIHTIVTAMPEVGATALIGAINSPEYRQGFRAYLRECSRAIGSLSPMAVAISVDGQPLPVSSPATLTVAGSTYDENGELIEGFEEVNKEE